MKPRKRWADMTTSSDSGEALAAAPCPALLRAALSLLVLQTWIRAPLDMLDNRQPAGPRAAGPGE